MSSSIVYNEDCMELMGRYPEKYFELAVVDPPYGIADKMVKTGFSKTEEKAGHRLYQNHRGTAKYLKNQLGTNQVDEMKKWDICPDYSYFEELKRVSKNQIIWGANYMPPVLNVLGVARCWLVWDKVISDKFTLSQFETAYTSFNKLSKIFVYANANCIGFAPKLKGVERVGLGIHPTQKPVALYDWIFKNYAKEGDKILDTHLGSGSSRIAAYKAGLDFVGCELDKEYFEAADKRFNEFKSQLRMF